MIHANTELAAEESTTLQLSEAKDKTGARVLADAVLNGVAGNAVTARRFASGTFGELDLNECALVLQQRVESVHKGDLKLAETLLTAQATTLDAIFNEMARRSALNLGVNLEMTERFMRLGLKAQGQCRATLETLSAIKNPPIIFAKQANIANGPQQVNNGGANTESSSRTREIQIQPNELLEDQSHVSTNLDTGTAPTTAGSHPAVEALATVKRSQKSRR